jgi:hypothetical protein
MIHIALKFGDFAFNTTFAWWWILVAIFLVWLLKKMF